jgi:hypothetical protein
MPIDQLVQNFGLPIGLLLWFIYQNYKISKEYNEYIKDIASKAVNALDSSTKTQSETNNVLERVERKLDAGSSN